MNKFIDLSIPINKNTPVYPGDPPVEVTPMLTLEKDGCIIHSLTIATHLGTHIDSPMHMIENGKSLVQFPLEKFTGNGICIDVSNGFSLEEIKKVEVPEDSIVFFYSGWDSHLQTDYYVNYPTIPFDVAQYLVSKNVKIVGIDFPSADNEPYEVHKLLLQNEVLIIESLVNLKELIGKHFVLYAFPLKINLDGSPVRVVAEI